jgi:hypothetical protein
LGARNFPQARTLIADVSLAGECALKLQQLKYLSKTNTYLKEDKRGEDGFAGLITCIVVLGLVSLWAVGDLRGELEHMHSQILRKSELSASIKVASKADGGDIRGMVLGAIHRAAPKDEDPFPMEPVETGSFRDL